MIVFNFQCGVLLFGSVLTVVTLSLAYCEVYIMSALIAFKVIPRASLYETTDEDLKYDHDQIILQTKKGSISIRIKID